MRDEVDRIIEDMKKQEIIEESQSPWVSLAVLVKKKDEILRFCVDYRRLNVITKKDSYPLPRINDIIEQLFLVLHVRLKEQILELLSSRQIKIRPEDRKKTAFSVGRGLWQFKVMSFAKPLRSSNGWWKRFCKSYSLGSAWSISMM